MELFDTHSHYNDEKFDSDLDEIIIKTYNAGITKFMCIGYNLKSSEKAIKLAEKYEKLLEKNMISEVYESLHDGRKRLIVPDVILLLDFSNCKHICIPYS